MQLTATEATCPLCKSPVSASAHSAEPTRLCEDCQRIVQTIRSGNARVASIDQTQARTSPQPQIAIPVQPELHEKMPCLAEEAANLEQPGWVIEPAPVSFNEATEAEVALLDFDELFDDEPFETAAAHETLPYLSEPFHSEDDSLGSHAMPEPIVEPASEQPSSSFADVESALAMTALETEVQNLPDEMAPTELHIDQVTGGQPSIVFLPNDVPTSPLEPQVEGWSFVPSDYPILLRPPEPSKLQRLRLPLVAAVMICLGVAGYFVIYRSSIAASQSGNALAQIQPGQTKPASADQSLASQASLAGTQAVIAQVGAEHTQSQSARAANEISEGRYSLQAAAFPNEAGANEFCERLKRAGVPAYVVSAEIAGRGKWFRVRVGRFETPQHAERFASEARLRARGAGVNLQLIVSTYDKP